MNNKQKDDDTPALVFVYNADSGLFNTLTDIAHKIFSPETYQCHLCELSHGHFTMREEWSAFIQELHLEGEFLHKDEFIKQYGNRDQEFPAIFFRRGPHLDLCIDASVINSCDSIDELKDIITQTCSETP